MTMKSNIAVSMRPEPHEYAPYCERYVSLVVGDDILVALEKQLVETIALLSSRSEADGDFRYSPGKWNVKEVLGHVADTERIFTYRALRISRNDKTPIEGFEQDDYIRYSPFERLSSLGRGRGVCQCPPGNFVAVPQPGRTCMDAPRRGQRERSQREGAGLHNRGA